MKIKDLKELIEKYKDDDGMEIIFEITDHDLDFYEYLCWYQFDAKIEDDCEYVIGEENSWLIENKVYIDRNEAVEDAMNEIWLAKEEDTKEYKDLTDDQFEKEVEKHVNSLDWKPVIIIRTE